MNKKIQRLVAAIIVVTFSICTGANAFAATINRGSYVIGTAGEGAGAFTDQKGQKLELKVSDCKFTISVDGVVYYNSTTPSTASFTFSKSEDLVYFFWLEGRHYVFDPYRKKVYSLGFTSVSGEKVSYFIATEGVTEISELVKGSTLRNPSGGTCIVDDKYFYMKGVSGGAQRFITRAELDQLDPMPEEKTPEPTPAKVETPKPDPTKAPTPAKLETPKPDPTKAPTPAKVETPKPDPTKAPAVKPTLAPAHTFAPMPTLKPIVVPTMRPVADLAVPSVAPNQVVTQFSLEWWWERYIHGEITWEQFWQAAFQMNIDTQSHTESTTHTTAEFYWDKYAKGQITWDQLTQVIWGNQWVVEKESSETEDTYYFYNPDGSIDHTHTEKHGVVAESGQGQGSAQAANAGTADVSVSETGKGGVAAESQTSSDTVSHTEVSGTVEAANQGHAEVAVSEVGHGSAQGTVVTTVGSNVGKSGSGKTKKAKASWHVNRFKGKKGNTRLVKVVNGHQGIICPNLWHNKKSLIAKFSKLKESGVIYVGYTANSHQILLLKKNGKAKIWHRGKKSGSWKPRTIKGKWNHVAEGKPSGLALRLVNTKTKKTKTIKNAKAKKIS